MQEHNINNRASAKKMVAVKWNIKKSIIGHFWREKNDASSMIKLPGDNNRALEEKKYYLGIHLVAKIE